jgi:hypothetical protein
MSYDAVLDWAGADFKRLIAVAEARSYRPEWVVHQIEESRPVSAHEAAILQRMIAEAGPFLSRRQRWIMRQIKIKPHTEEQLATMAASAPEYRELKLKDRAVHNDIVGLIALGLVREHGSKVQAVERSST